MIAAAAIMVTVYIATFHVLQEVMQLCKNVLLLTHCLYFKSIMMVYSIWYKAFAV